MTDPARELLGQLLADEPPIAAAALARTALHDGRRRRRRRRTVQAACGLACAGLVFAGVQHLLAIAPAAVAVPAVVASSPGPSSPSPSASAAPVTDAEQLLRNLLAARHLQVTDQHGFAAGDRTPDGSPLVRGGFNTSAGGSVDVSIEHAATTCQVTGCRTLPDGRSYVVSRDRVPHVPGFEVLSVIVFDADRVVCVSARTYPLTPDGQPVLSAHPAPLALNESDLLEMTADPLWSRADG
ncbi:MAG: hypothetical protein ACTHOD_00995 [Motilibacteraceae bacterium]